ncbi:MAG: type II/IV secretion system ATPase subunit [Candidatus Bathyarchaeota archaeon]|nr:MAG: type II/IV secretion system ATPase subunit [Candidatus Bathyarchaeota archaeon]
MHFKLKPGGKNTKEDKEEGISEEALIGYLDIEGWTVPEGYFEVETYPLKPPFSYATIAQNEDTAEYLYSVNELILKKEEAAAFNKMRNILEYALKAPKDGESLTHSFHEQMPRILNDHPKVFRNIPTIETKKIQYYLERDIIGYGKIDPLMFDPYIEDISCNGPRKPMFLWHRNYENIKTNILFQNEEKLNNFIMRIVHRAGKHVSIAFPIVDITLPGKHRLAVSFGTEITPTGTNFTIRKFRKDPFTIIDLIENETIDETIAAYLWLLMETKTPLMVIGATGAGKTTALNAIACLIRPNYKIITVEEVAEINLPHENWSSTISRSGFGVEQEGEIPLFDLVKSAVRHRPDIIIVGEVRGEEAYVLFQALSTGHGGVCTMHAEDVEAAVQRLTQPPMNIPASIIPLMRCAIMVKHVRKPLFVKSGKRLSSRKFTRISEIKGVDTIQDVSVWNASSDTFQNNLSNSFLLKRIAKDLDMSNKDLMQELEHRRRVLLGMTEHHIRGFREVNNSLNKYHQNPRFLFEEISRTESW